jgi:hypothetical protein
MTIAQVVHPTCELGKADIDSVQVCKVRLLSDLSDDFKKSCVVAGMREKDGQQVTAFANTFFLPALSPPHEGMFADFRELHLVDRIGVSLNNRQAALTHDCRVYFIRRWFYFRFRILLSLQQVFRLEERRISGDKNFQGPRPSWASFDGA